MNYDQVRIPITCRFVASDQWLTTYFDSTCKILEVKQYILAKVYNRSVPDNDDQPSRNRPVSPITFASARNSFDSNFDDSLLQDDHVIDLDPHLLSDPTRQPRTIRQPLSQRVASPSSGIARSPTEQLPAIIPPHHYPILAFSTGQLLEDDCSLAWYRLRPHELLELHPPGTIVRFPRDIMLEYIKPYLELDVRALRVIVNDKDTHAFGPAYAAPDAPSPSKNKKPKEKELPPDCPSASGSGSPASQSTRKRRKTKLEWRDRYLVIRQGMLSLFKSRTDLTPVHTCPLAKLTTLRGQEEIVHTTTAAKPSPHVVCAKFRADVSTPVFPEPQPVTSPITDQWNDPWSGGVIPRETDGFLWGKRESKEDIKQQRRSVVEGNQQSKANTIPKEDLFDGRTPDGKGESLRYDINIGDGTQGTWLVLDTLDEHAYSNLLRVLHRCSPDTINTTLVPKYLLPDDSFSSPCSLSSPLPSPSGALGGSSCRYPEWRIEVSQRAQQSGLGSVSDAMAWVLCGGPPLDPPVSKISSPELRRKISDFTTDDSSTAHDPFNFGVDDDGGDNDDCELEWDSWAEDLMRQALAISSNDIAVTVTEPVSIHPSYPNRRIRPTASSSTFSSVNLSEQGGRLPCDILPGANMGLLSVDSPALLTAPSVLPFQSTGITTSTVSAGGVVRTRSLMAIDGRRGRGVARAMEVLSEDSDDGPFTARSRTGRQKRTREDNGRGGAMASSAPVHSGMAMPAPTANTITSTVTVRESVGTPSPPPLQFHGSPPGSFYAERSARAVTSSASASASASASTSASTSTSPVLTAAAAAAAGGGNVSETASVRSGVTTMTTTTTIQLLPRRSSTAGGEMLLPEASSPPPSQKRSDKSEKGKGKQRKNSSRGKVFRPERLVSKLDSTR